MKNIKLFEEFTNEGKLNIKKMTKAAIKEFGKGSTISPEDLDYFIDTYMDDNDIDFEEFDEDEIYPYRIEGLGKNLIPTATDFDVIDLFDKVSDEDSAHSSREIALKEGLFVGYTSGAAMQAVKQLSKLNHFDENSNVVLIFCDHGSRYMSKIYSDKWMHDQGFFNFEKSELEKPIEYIK